jgi:Domain of unknown function (DUF4157)
MRQQVAQPGSKENVARTQMRQPQPAVQRPQPRGVTAELLNLQRTHGNRFVQQLLNGGMLQRKCACGGGCPRCQKASLLQTKLKINEPGDRYEQEADRIADRVMRMPEPSIQRQMEPEEDEEEGMVQREIANQITPVVQRQVLPEMEEEEEEGIMQRKALTNRVSSLGQKQESSKVPPIVHEVLNSPGQPLDPETCTFMEPRFGQDFSQVRVHTDTKAAESARAVNALAYTVGRDIVFSTGQYAPGTTVGKHMLAHELAHTMQQQDIQIISLQKQSKTNEAEDQLENEAERAASEVVARADQEPTLAVKLPAKKPKSARKTKPAKKPKSAKNPCTKDIWYEGTCQYLVNNSKYVCCDPQNGLTPTKIRRSDIEDEKCPSNKFTYTFTCDNNCSKALKKGCSDNDNWMAIPKNARKQCDKEYTICYKGKQTKGYVRDNSSVGQYEVSPGIKKNLGVTEKQGFKGAVYPPNTKQETIDQNPCCKSSLVAEEKPESKATAYRDRLVQLSEEEL